MEGANWLKNRMINDDDLYEGYLGSGREPPPATDEDGGNERSSDPEAAGATGGEGWAESKSTEHTGKVPWFLMAATMTAEVIGNGVLSLPRAFARLGWIPAQIVLFLLFAVTTYTGMLIYRARNAYPTSRSYPSLFFNVYGKGGHAYASVIVYVLLFMYTAAGLLVQAESWEAALPNLNVVSRTFVAMACSFLVLQLRTMKNVGALSVISVISIIVPIIISYVMFNNMIASGEYPVGEKVLAAGNFSEGVVAVMDMVYAFAGHVVFLELLTQIRNPTKFPRALYVSQGLTYAVYLVVATIFYALVGDACWLTSPFTAAVSPGTAKYVIQGFIILHITVGIAVNGNILVRAVQNAIEPGTRKCLGNEEPQVAARDDISLRAILWWALWSLVALTICTLTVILIPNFEIFIGLTAALAASQTTLAWPGILDLKLFHGSRSTVKGYLKSFLSVCAIVSGIFCFVVGVGSTLYDFIDNPQNGSTPQECDAPIGRLAWLSSI